MNQHTPPNHLARVHFRIQNLVLKPTSRNLRTSLNRENHSNHVPAINENQTSKHTTANVGRRQCFHITRSFRSVPCGRTISVLITGCGKQFRVTNPAFSDVFPTAQRIFFNCSDRTNRVVILRASVRHAGVANHLISEGSNCRQVPQSKRRQLRIYEAAKMIATSAQNGSPKVTIEGVT